MNTATGALRLLSIPLAASAALLAWAGEAHALVNGGVEAGIVERTGSDVAPAIGAHLELNPILGLYVGGYYFRYSHDAPNMATDFSPNVATNILGGRLRYILSLFGDALKPYALVGVGYARLDYPAVPTLTGGITSPTQSNVVGSLETRDGHFVEIPLGVGIAHQAFKIVQFDLGFTYRPGTSFGGSAYEGVTAYREPTSGWSLTLGASLDF